MQRRGGVADPGRAGAAAQRHAVGPAAGHRLARRLRSVQRTYWLIY